MLCIDREPSYPLLQVTFALIRDEWFSVTSGSDKDQCWTSEHGDKAPQSSKMGAFWGK
jgi:hypothetical protein